MSFAFEELKNEPGFDSAIQEAARFFNDYNSSNLESLLLNLGTPLDEETLWEFRAHIERLTSHFDRTSTESFVLRSLLAETCSLSDYWAGNEEAETELLELLPLADQHFGVSHTFTRSLRTLYLEVSLMSSVSGDAFEQSVFLFESIDFVNDERLTEGLLWLVLEVATQYFVTRLDDLWYENNDPTRSELSSVEEKLEQMVQRLLSLTNHNSSANSQDKSWNVRDHYECLTLLADLDMTLCTRPTLVVAIAKLIELF